MKIGILTFHNTVNYGATLQTYALLDTVDKIKSSDSSVEIIDYMSKYISRYNVLEELKRKKGLRKIGYCFFSIPFIKAKIKCFEHFDLLHMKLSAKKYSYVQREEIGLDYDMIIAGSDQIFNRGLIKDDLVYLLDIPRSNIVKMVYAASFGNYDSGLFLEDCREIMKDIDFISLRENQSKEILENELNKAVEWVLDPTLLLKKNEWAKLEEEIAIPKKYLFVYLVSPSKTHIAYIKRIAKKMKLPIIYIPYSSMDYHFGYRSISSVTPGQFLYLISNAEYIVTNSFHGTVLSINYEKNFSSLYSAKNQRLESILKMLGIEQALQCIGEDFCENKFDYGEIGKKLEEKRKESINFLNQVNVRE